MAPLDVEGREERMAAALAEVQAAIDATLAAGDALPGRWAPIVCPECGEVLAIMRDPSWAKCPRCQVWSDNVEGRGTPAPGPAEG